MISKEVAKAVINSAKEQNKNVVLEAIINHLKESYDYNDVRQNHVLEMLINTDAVITPARINMEYLENNLSTHIYKYDECEVKDIKISNIDNISCDIKFDYLRKEVDDTKFRDSYFIINVNDTPNIILK